MNRKRLSNHPSIIEILLGHRNVVYVRVRTAQDRTPQRESNRRYVACFSHCSWRRESVVRTSAFRWRTFPDLCPNMVDRWV